MKTIGLNALAPMDMSEKVSIIIPVYNAEKFLGYCLNSVLSQSYTNWEAILVNDGSTDGSLEICENFAALDSRFKVISIPNGGVSNARNVGLEQATGKYLHFLDSDDVLALETIERQVRAAREYGKQLVVSDLLIVDFTNPSNPGPRLSGKWLKGKPAVLDAEAFRENRMRIIWYSSLLEGLYGKLYSRELWETLKLRFPRELSLGEDFVTNMQYYAACNGVVFLQQIGHYYNNIVGSNSLTHKYRPDLFENKMLLMEELWRHLHIDHAPDQEELAAFYNYVAATGLRCVAEIVNLEKVLTRKEKIERLQVMCNHVLFAESLAKATYIDAEFHPYLGCIQKKDYRQLVKQKSISGTGSKRTLINRAVRKVMRIVRPVFGQSAMGERLGRWEQEIAQHGLKHTIRSHKEAHQKKKSYLTEKNPGKIRGEIQESNRLITSEYLKLKNELNNIQKRDAEFEEIMIYEISAIARAVNDYTWISEQRMTRERYLSEVNELRQKKKAIMVATAEHANIGDSAITLAEQYILKNQFPEYFQIEISTYEYEKKKAFLHAIINPEDIIFINGGGNLGDKYMAEEDLHCEIVEDFPNNKIIIFPQTISFSDTESGKQALKRSAYVYNHHPDLTLFVRGETSLEFAKTHFSNVKTFLMPDVVHVLRSDYHLVRNGALLCLREDEEGWMDSERKEIIRNVVLKQLTSIDTSTNIHHEDVTRDIRGLVVREEFKKFARHQIVVTDRLHGMIFSAITNTPCVVISSYNHKIKEYYDAFFADSNAIFFIGDDLEQLDDALNRALEVANPQYPVFETDPYANIRKNA